MKTAIILSLLLLCAFPAVAHDLKGTITDTNNNPLEYSNVTILSRTDSTLVAGSTADSLGCFSASLPTGKYIVRITCLGYKQAYIDVDLHSGCNLGQVKMAADATVLDEVTVTAARPTVKRIATGMIVSIDGVAHLQNKTLDRILNMSPGVFIDREGNISINGRSVATVIINDKTMRLTGDQLVAYMKSIQGSDLKEIEIMSAPTSAYDASGTGGIIKITTRRKRDIGATGYASANYSYAQRSAYNPAAGLAYTSGNFTLYGNYSYNNSRNVQQSHRNDYYATSSQTNLNDEYAHTVKSSHNYRIGIDWNINRQHYLGLEYNGATSKHDSDGNSAASVYLADDISQQIATTSTGTNMPHNNSVSLNYAWQIDTIGQTLKFVTDYTSVAEDDGAVNNYVNDYYDGSGSHTGNLNKQEVSDESATIYSAKLDYEKPFRQSGWKLAAGAKFSYVRNNYSYLMLSWENGGTPVEDTRFTDRFRFTEKLYAAYLNASYASKRLDANAGVRAEYTDREGISYAQSERNSTTDFRLFPSAFLYWKPSTTHGFMLYYGMRIYRPPYQILNPFVTYLTDLSYKMGNPDLKPEITNALEMTYVLKNKYFVSLRANFTDNRIRDYTFTNGQYVVQSTTNLSGYRWYYLNAYAPFGYKMWSSSALLNIGLIDSKDASGMRSHTFAMDLTWDNYLYFTDNLSCQLRVAYSPPYKDVYQNWHKHIAEVNINLDYALCHGKLMLNFGVDDVLNMKRTRRITFSYPELREEMKMTGGSWTGRTLYVGIKFNFSTAKQARQRQKERSNQDEINRL